MIKDEAIQRYKTAWQEENGCPMLSDDAYMVLNYAVSIRALMDADKPLPVDPDLLLARKIVAADLKRAECHSAAAEVLEGNRLDATVSLVFAGIKAGKAMR